MTKNQAEIVARWLGWIEEPETAGWSIKVKPYGWLKAVDLDYLLTGNGMIEILAKMRTEPEERRRRFWIAVWNRLHPHVERDPAGEMDSILVSKFDELTPDIVRECAAEVLK